MLPLPSPVLEPLEPPVEALLLAEASACTGSGMAYFSSIKACRSVNCFEKIELRGEGTYGQVS